MSDADQLRAFYVEAFDEDARLRARPHGVLERVRTHELFDRYLPAPPARVLDVGGATGVHAEWLAARGHAVHLVDPVPEHVARASALPGVTAAIGDARSLAEEDDTQDAVLLLGPLYHLLERADRLKALRDAARVARSGAPVLAAAISRHATLMDLATDGRLTAEREAFVLRTIDEGRFAGGEVGFMDTYFHRPAELADELRAAGLRDVEVLGIEGPAAPTLRMLGMERLDELLDAAVRAARLVERDPAMLAASSHLLAVGRA